MVRAFHKVAGFGLCDLKHRDDGALDDPRLIYEMFYERLRESAIGLHIGMATFLKWCKHHRDALVQVFAHETPDDPAREVDLQLKQWRKVVHQNHFRRWRPSDSIVWDPTHGDPAVLLFLPPEFVYTWHRIHDPIDVAQLPHLFEGGWHDVETGIEPYNTMMVRRRVVSPALLRGCGEFTYPTELGRVWLDDHGPTFMHTPVFGLMDVAGGHLLEHFRTDWRPQVPVSVIALMMWLGCFRNLHASVCDVRALVYEYWR